MCSRSVGPCSVFGPTEEAGEDRTRKMTSIGRTALYRQDIYREVGARLVSEREHSTISYPISGIVLCSVD
jgi:hypothetical protein